MAVIRAFDWRMFVAVAIVLADGGWLSEASRLLRTSYPALLTDGPPHPKYPDDFPQSARRPQRSRAEPRERRPQSARRVRGALERAKRDRRRPAARPLAAGDERGSRSSAADAGRSPLRTGQERPRADRALRRAGRSHLARPSSSFATRSPAPRSTPPPRRGKSGSVRSMPRSPYGCPGCSARTMREAPNARVQVVAMDPTRATQALEDGAHRSRALPPSEPVVERARPRALQGRVRRGGARVASARAASAGAPRSRRSRAYTSSSRACRRRRRR